MASYVAKNGTDFEAIVKSKGDPRFVFLNPEHEYHNYYKYKISVYANFSKKSTENETGAGKDSEDCKKIKEKKVIAPVSFSIKKAKENETTIEKSALPVEESDEEDNKEQTCEIPEKLPEIPTNEETTSLEISSGNSKEDTVTVASNKKESNDNEPEIKINPTEDPLLELIDLTDDLEERRDAKRAEDRLKDKIAAAAREKLSSSSRDKALQLERKKRAAAFLSQLKKGGTDERESKRVKTETSEGETVKTEIRVKNSDSEEEGEIKSKHQKSRRKKSHKRKRSKTKHERKEHKRDHKKSKKHRRRNSTSSCNSDR